MEQGDILYNCYFWLSLTGLIIGFFHYSMRSCERSRCLTLKCCGVSLMERTLEEGNVLPLIRTDTSSL